MEHRTVMDELGVAFVRWGEPRCIFAVGSIAVLMHSHSVQSMHKDKRPNTQRFWHMIGTPLHLL